MTRRERIFNKFNGLCAYSGTPLEPDWQIDHIEPVYRYRNGQKMIPDNDTEDNMVPCQRAINNYKGSYTLFYFRVNLLMMLHLRLNKYPRHGKGGELRKRMEKIAAYFGITEDKPFSGIFYFEKVKKHCTECDQLNDDLDCENGEECTKQPNQ